MSADCISARLGRAGFGLAMALAGGAVLWSCGGDAAGPDRGAEVASITITPSTASLKALGDTLRLSAAARNGRGGTIAGRSFTWSSSDQAVANVSASGLVSAVAEGTTSVTAATGGVSGSASVTVSLTGGLRIITTTEGRNLDPDGYTVVLDGASVGTIGTNDTVTVDDLAAGGHTISLAGLRDTCHELSAPPVSTVIGSVMDARLRVECLGVPEDVALVFVRTRPDSASISLAGLANGETVPVQLTFFSQTDRAPAWSPDGTRLAFSRFNVIRVVNSDGTDFRSFESGTNPAWSPDGTKIAYERADRVFIFEPDGPGGSTLFATGYEPAWSPDGTRIAYVVPVDGAPVAQSDIFVVNLDGSGRVNLTQNPELLDREPAWSPDGSAIVFRRLNRSESYGYDLWTMDADGSNQTRILMRPGPQTDPIWLPDDRILFQDEEPSVLDLGNGAAVTQLTLSEAGVFNFSPTWRPR